MEHVKMKSIQHPKRRLKTARINNVSQEEISPKKLKRRILAEAVYEK